ncbi:hypothetical protein QF002_005523 [Paraburkholderia youngii]
MFGAAADDQQILDRVARRVIIPFPFLCCVVSFLAYQHPLRTTADEAGPTLRSNYSSLLSSLWALWTTSRTSLGCAYPARVGHYARGLLVFFICGHWHNSVSSRISGCWNVRIRGCCRCARRAYVWRACWQVRSAACCSDRLRSANRFLCDFDCGFSEPLDDWHLCRRFRPWSHGSVGISPTPDQAWTPARSCLNGMLMTGAECGMALGAALGGSALRIHGRDGLWPVGVLAGIVPLIISFLDRFKGDTHG